MMVETKPVELQESFQSTSTSKYLESRFLIWNNIGAITCYSEQIQISFHDVSYHHSITIDNKTDKYSLGDLSLSAVALASSQTGKLICILYQSWDSNMREWTINTENNDKIEIVSLCEDFFSYWYITKINSFNDFIGYSTTCYSSSRTNCFNICLSKSIMGYSSFNTRFLIVFFSQLIHCHWMILFRSFKRTSYVICTFRHRK